MVEEHINHVRQVLWLLHYVGVILNLKNCELFTNRVDYLNDLLRPGCLKDSEQTVHAIPELEYPTTLTELRAFSGHCKVHLCFAPNFDLVATPLDQKLFREHWQNFIKLADKEITVLETLKEKLVEPRFSPSTVVRLPYKK